MSIIIALLIFCIIVVSHEFGHFIVAKKTGIPVKEFWVGFGPTIISWNKNGTKYCIKPIPFGGACVFYDAPIEEEETESPDNDNISENENQISEKSVESDDLDKEVIKDRDVDPSWYFNNAKVWKRMLTILAGPCFNFILAYIFSLIIISYTGYSTTEVIGVGEGMPAYEAGIKEGDVIVKMDNERIHMYEEFTLNTMLNRGEPVTITYERDGKRYKTDITPKYYPEYGRYMFGITFGAIDVNQNVITTFQYAGYYVNYSIKNVLKSLMMIFRGRVKAEEVSGVVGMTSAIDEVYTEAKNYGFLAVVINMMNIATLLSANLGVINLLPIPALDGGRFIFLVVEAIRRKPLDREKEGYVHFIGFALIMILTVIVMYNDIVKLFK